MTEALKRKLFIDRAALLICFLIDATTYVNINRLIYSHALCMGVAGVVYDISVVLAKRI